MSVLQCAACGFGNRPGALYCGSCGDVVGQTCSSCGALVERGLAFCTICGARLEDAATAAVLAEERKVVSVLFADLVGFTERAESLDPEDVRRLLAPYYSRLREELQRFGGTVEKFIGDAVVGLFGAPITHEDDAERAVRAALAVREAIAELNRADPSLGLQVRIAVTTGEAVIDLRAQPGKGEGMATGDVVNTCARLQSLAPVDGILVDEPTYRATREAIEYRDCAPVRPRGKTQAMAVWEAVAPRARLGVDIAFRGRAALVGRRHELDVLVEALARARRERSPQLVTIVGAPGIGKSRLVFELFATIESQPDLINWRQGRSLPYGEGVSLWALGEMVKAEAGILETDSAEQARVKLASAVAGVLADGDEAAWVLRHLRPLAGLAREAEPGADGQGEAFAAWRRFFEALAEPRPLVLVFEDAHWADDGLLDFVDHLVDWATAVPLLVVCTARPELLERRPDWSGGKRNAVTLSLSPLADAEAAALLEALAGEPPSPELVASTGGNPLYAEEYARMLAQTGDGGGRALPDSVQGIIAARLDTLPAAEKALLQDAAVVGKVFWPPALAALGALDAELVDERLRALDRKEFVRRERRSSVAGENAYVFRHVLVGDVAYGQLPRARRAEKHRLAAEWLEALAADRSEDVAEMLAHHYLSALEYCRATGGDTAALEERARIAFRDAGDRAAALNAFAAAERFYRAALEHWPEDDPERPQLLFRHGCSRFYSQDEGEEELARAAEELLDAGDRRSAAEAETLVGELRWIEGDRERAFEHFEAAAALLADEPPSRAKAFVLGTLSRVLMAADEAERSIEIGFQAFEMAEALDLDDVRAHVLATIGVARMTIGDPGGRVDLERAIEISERINSPEAIRAYNNLASSYAALGDLEHAFDLYEHARRAAERFGRVRALRWLEAERMVELYWRGRWDDALRLADEFVAQAEAGLPHHREVDARVMRARIALARGDTALAERESARAVDFGRRVRDPQNLFPALAFQARALLAAARPDAASKVASGLLESWGKAGMTFAAYWLADAALVLADLDRHGDIEQAAAYIRMPTRWLDAALAIARGADVEAAAVYAQIGSLPDEAEARLRAAEAFVGAGRRGEADGELRLALDFYRSVGADAYVRRAEGLLAAAG